MKLALFHRSHEAPEDRNGRRLKVFLPVILTWSGREEHAHLSDVSQKGAKLSASVIPITGARIQFDWEGETFSGWCIWSRGNMFGMMFDRPLTHDALMTLAI
ncbi:hypothetical protein BH10PSE12_BH10PSE12_19600 [soil metagenome]